MLALARRSAGDMIAYVYERSGGGSAGNETRRRSGVGDAASYREEESRANALNYRSGNAARSAVIQTLPRWRGEMGMLRH